MSDSAIFEGAGGLTVTKRESMADQANRVVTYDISDGRSFRVDMRDVREYGIANILRAEGIKINLTPVPVYQRGKKIGTVDGDFEPVNIRSTSMFYEPRGGDFTRKSDRWDAANSMCPGDFEAIPGFMWDRQ